MKKLNISEKDLKLLFILLTIVILAGTFYFIYQPNMNKAQTYRTETEQLNRKLKELEVMQGQRAKKLQETADFKEQTAAILNGFPVAVTTEDCIALMDKLEKTIGIQISAESFNISESIYMQEARLAEETAETAPEESAAPAQAAAGTTGDEPKEPTGPVMTVNGYKSTITISYRCTYDEFKATLDFIESNADRMTVEAVDISYDSGTGDLSGNMSIGLYSVNVANSDIYQRQYNVPDVESSGYGTPNIFGTSSKPAQSTAQ